MTILNKYTELEQIGTTWGWSSTCILGILTAGISIFIAYGIIVIICDNIEIDFDLFFAFSLAFILFITLTVVSFHDKPIYKEVTYYEVTINDNYSAKDLLNNYTIVEQRGDIILIKELSKETED